MFRQESASWSSFLATLTHTKECIKIFEALQVITKKKLNKEKQNKHWLGTVPPDSNVLTFDLLYIFFHYILLPVVVLPCKHWLQTGNRAVTLPGVDRLNHKCCKWPHNDDANVNVTLTRMPDILMRHHAVITQSLFDIFYRISHFNLGSVTCTHPCTCTHTQLYTTAGSDTLYNIVLGF